MPNETLEQRVRLLEEELAQLKQEVRASKNDDSMPAWMHIVGIFKDDPLFDEAERLGREWRDAQGPVNYDADADSSARH
jgi:hypothetical protein